MTKATRQLSNSTVSGDGLRNATVGKTAYIAVTVDKRSLHHFHFSVLAVGRDHIFVVNPFKKSRTSKGLIIHFKYMPTLSGTYDLYVEEIELSQQKQLSGSPFLLTVDGPPMKPSDIRMQSNQKPPCQTMNQRNYTWLNGEWVTRVFAGNERGTLRSGWVFQPKMCSFDIFTKEDLSVAAQSPTTIVVLGTSTERGVFLSLIDLALYDREKDHLDISDVGKCWGYTRVSLGNLTFIYQDFRLFTLWYGQNNHQITCHNEKLASQNLKLLELDAEVFIREFLFKTDKYPPNVILLVVKGARQLRLLVDQIPSEWKGTIYAVHNLNSRFSRLYTHDGQAEAAREMRILATVDPRINILDGFHLGAGMRHATESSPLIMGSLHLHRWCNELNGEMRVCGNPTEMAAQILLGKAIAPNGKKNWNNSRRTTKTWVRDIEICYDCPRSLLPFHLKRKPELQCYKGNDGLKPRNETNTKVWDGSLCPKECMDTEPVDTIHSQTDTVYVRVCAPPS